MAIRPDQIAAAEAAQHTAALDTSDQVRLVAGPGTGKSSTVEERVQVADCGWRRRGFTRVRSVLHARLGERLATPRARLLSDQWCAG